MLTEVVVDGWTELVVIRSVEIEWIKRSLPFLSAQRK
jgi:hypothetical protein